MNWNLQSEQHDDIVVNASNRASLLANIGELFSVRKGFSLATINLDHVTKLAKNEDFARAYAKHTHVTADGNPIVWLERLSGRKETQLIPGSELIEPVAALAKQHNVKVALFGSTDASLEAAASALKVRHPGLDVVLTLAPAMGFDPNGASADDAIAKIKSSDAQLVFLALGAPKQEIFAARAHAALPETGFMSIGAGLDFVSGEQKRAPKFVQKIAMEWLWRMLSNPKRLAGRYLACFAILPRLTLRALVARKAN